MQISAHSSKYFFRPSEFAQNAQIGQFHRLEKEDFAGERALLELLGTT
jgi:hypothetical protein